jgi:hypothetical protein
MDLAFDDMLGQFLARIGNTAVFKFLGAPTILYRKKCISCG